MVLIKNITKFVNQNGIAPGKCLVTIANNWRPNFNNGLYGSVMSPPHPSIMIPFKRFDGGAFHGLTPAFNPLLPAKCTDGTNLMYNGTVDSIGSISEPLYMNIIGYKAKNPSLNQYHDGLFEEYEPTAGWAGNEIHTWSWANDGATTNPRRIYGVLRLINLPNLKHLYLRGNFAEHNYQNAYMKYTGGSAGPENQFDYNEIGAAAFTTKGCHADLKIHVGSIGKVEDMEKAYGTADVTSSVYSVKGEAFFLKYFESTHRFVV